MCHLPSVSRVATWGVFCLAASATSAQTVYRCADSYSHTPCTGALAIPVDDSRSSAQKAQTDAATVQTRLLAGQMERERLALEKSAQTAKPTHPLARAVGKAQSNIKGGKPAGASNGPQASRTSSKKKPKEPEFFTASATSDKKSKTGGAATD